MNSSSTRRHKVFGLVAPLLIFTTFFSLFSISYVAGGGKMFGDDIFYHAAHALAYLRGEQFVYPIFSTYSTYPVDLYLGFHWLMAYFIQFADTQNPESVLWSLRLMNSMLAAFYFTLFYLVARAFGRKFLSLSISRSSILAIVATILLSSVTNAFVFRMLLIRPHLLLVSFVLGSFYFALSRRFVSLFLVSVFTPLFYSISFMVLIPPAVVTLSELCIRKFKIKSVEPFLPLLVGFFGILVGIFIHPNSLNYLYNGYFAHIMAVVSSSFISTTAEGAEMYAPMLGISDYLWLLSLIAIFAITITRYIKKGSLEHMMSVGELSVFILSSVFFGLYMLIGRASEYFFPFWSLLAVSVFYRVFTEPLSAWFSIKETDDGSFHFSISRAITWVAEWLKDNRRALLIVAPLGLLAMFSASWLGIMGTMFQLDASNRYKSAAEFIERDSGGTGLVFLGVFSDFPRLVFYNHANTYSMGMGSMFTFLYDKKLYWKYWHIVRGEQVCGKKTCDSSDENPGVFETLRDVFHTQYIFVHLNDGIPDSTPTRSFVKKLDHDVRFKKVFTDSSDPSVMVYRLEGPKQTGL